MDIQPRDYQEIVEHLRKMMAFLRALHTTTVRDGMETYDTKEVASFLNDHLSIWLPAIIAAPDPSPRSSIGINISGSLATWQWWDSLLQNALETKQKDLGDLLALAVQDLSWRMDDLAEDP
jgi:hypothetical protein